MEPSPKDDATEGRCIAEARRRRGIRSCGAPARRPAPAGDPPETPEDTDFWEAGVRRYCGSRRGTHGRRRGHRYSSGGRSARPGCFAAGLPPRSPVNSQRSRIVVGGRSSRSVAGPTGEDEDTVGIPEELRRWRHRGSSPTQCSGVVAV